MILFAAVGVAEKDRTDASGLWTYALEDGAAVITGHTGEPDGALVIPGELDGHAVTRIGRSAFKDCAITGVTIPDSVTHIEDYAFAFCVDLAALTIPDSVTSIGDSAFFDCILLTRVTIPAGVTHIEANPFGTLLPEGSALEFIDVSPGNPRYEQRDGVLFDKQQHVLVSYPGAKKGSYAVPKGVSSIGNGAFFGCYELTSVTIPDGVMRIGESAFFNCFRLTGVKLPRRMGNICESAFFGCSRLSKVVIPQGVTEISDMAFKWCGLTGVTIPDGVTRIGEEAFAGCESLERATIPESVTDIGEYAFDECEQLTFVVREDSAAHAYAMDNDIPFELAEK